MYSLLLLCCLVSAVTAVIPVVSESFSFEGRATRSTSSGDTVYSVYNVAVDRDRSLLLIETETGGESGFRLESDTANLLIQSWGGCVGGAYTQNTDNPFSISTDPWEFLSNPNTFDVDEAFTLIEGSTTIRARFGADLLPYHYEYTTTSSQNLFIVEIDRFYNVTPPFYTFDLPSACSSVTCTPCYTGTQPLPTTTPTSSAGTLRSLVTALIVSGMLILVFV